MTEIERRVAAVTATWKHFRGRPFAFGKTDCVKVAAWHLRKLGHRPTGLAKAGQYRSALTAKRALARAGFDSLSGALASVGLARIAPAAALPGDIIVGPGDQGWQALGIYAGNGMLFGFYADDLAAGLQAIRLSNFTVVEAWRV